MVCFGNQRRSSTPRQTAIVTQGGEGTAWDFGGQLSGPRKLILRTRSLQLLPELRSAADLQA
jgi:hypothetical protein